MHIEWGKIERFSEPGKPFAVVEMRADKELTDTLSMLKAPVQVYCDGQAFGFIELVGSAQSASRIILRSHSPVSYLRTLTQGKLFYDCLEVSSGDPERDRARRIRRGIAATDDQA